MFDGRNQQTLEELKDDAFTLAAAPVGAPCLILTFSSSIPGTSRKLARREEEFIEGLIQVGVLSARQDWTVSVGPGQVPGDCLRFVDPVHVGGADRLAISASDFVSGAWDPREAIQSPEAIAFLRAFSVRFVTAANFDRPCAVMEPTVPMLDGKNRRFLGPVFEFD